MFLNVILVAYLYFIIALFGIEHASTAVPLAVMTWWSLYAASLHHPGPVADLAIDEVTDGPPCLPCGITSKPQRVHHCRHCEECIDRFDHHCDWIDNCIGRQNYKAFTLFLVYISLSILHFSSCLYHFFAALLTFKSISLPARGFLLNIVLVLIYSLVVVPCAVLAAVFLWRTLWNAARDVTTFEVYVGTTVGVNSCRHKTSAGVSEWMSPISWFRVLRRLRRNLEVSFGPLSLLWLFPTMVCSNHRTIQTNSPV